jgi:hypothetical protein
MLKKLGACRKRCDQPHKHQERPGSENNPPADQTQMGRGKNGNRNSHREAAEPQRVEPSPVATVAIPRAVSHATHLPCSTGSGRPRRRLADSGLTVFTQSLTASTLSGGRRLRNLRPRSGGFEEQGACGLGEGDDQRRAEVGSVLVGAAGIEPATTCSQSRYATAALRPAGGDYRTGRPRHPRNGQGAAKAGRGEPCA